MGRRHCHRRYVSRVRSTDHQRTGIDSLDIVLTSIRQQLEHTTLYLSLLCSRQSMRINYSRLFLNEEAHRLMQVIDLHDTS